MFGDQTPEEQIKIGQSGSRVTNQMTAKDKLIFSLGIDTLYFLFWRLIYAILCIKYLFSVFPEKLQQANNLSAT